MRFLVARGRVAVSVLLLGGSSAWAESSPAMGCHHSADHEMAECELTSIVVVASTPKKDKGYLIVANPKDSIQPVPASDGADYLKHIPGFNAIRNGGTNGDPVFRGMFGSRLKILTNGSEMLGACPARMDAPTSYISPENFDEVTIVKGPQTVLWGVGSAATINFSTKPQRFEKTDIRGQSSVIAGSNHRFDSQVEATLGNPLGYLRLNANTSESDDYKDGHGDKVAAKWRKWNTDVALGYTPDADTWFELSAGTGDGEARYAGRGMDGAQFLRESVGLRFEQKNISDTIKKIEAQLNYNYAEHVMDNFTLRRPTPMMMGGMQMDMGMNMGDGSMVMELARATTSGRIAATLEWQQLQLVTGLDASESQHKGRSNMAGRDYEQLAWEKDAKYQNLGGFGELTWQLDPKRKWVSGFRLDHVRVQDQQLSSAQFNQSREENLPSGFIRYEQKLTSPTSVYAGLGYAARFPDYWELFSAQTGPRLNSNPFNDIQAEKTLQLDTGIQYQDQKINAWASAYVGKVNDYILFDYAAMQSQVRNVDATIWGGETGLNYRFNDYVSAQTSLAYAWGRNDSDHQALPQIPPLDFRLGLNYQQQAYSLGALWRLVAAQDRIALNQGNVVGQDLSDSPSFGVFSLNGNYKISKQFSLSAGVDNVFNKNYAEHLNKAGNASFGYASNQIINDLGRNYWAKLTVKY